MNEGRDKNKANQKKKGISLCIRPVKTLGKAKVSIQSGGKTGEIETKGTNDTKRKKSNGLIY